MLFLTETDILPLLPPPQEKEKQHSVQSIFPPNKTWGRKKKSEMGRGGDSYWEKKETGYEKRERSLLVVLLPAASYHCEKYTEGGGFTCFSAFL